MKPRLFKFVDKTSSDTRAFGEILRDTSPRIQQRLFDSFGLKATLHGLDHDGRKVGIGSFWHKGEEINFAIAPKEASLRLDTIFRALGNDQGVLINHVKFENTLSEIEVTQDDPENFTPFFLLGLLDEIIRRSIDLLNISLKKRSGFVSGGIRGRPLLARSFQDIWTGRQFGFWCQLPDDQGLRDYAVVMLATANSISNTLDKLRGLIPLENHDYLSQMRHVFHRFGTIDLSLFRLSLLYKVCRPPFPYGLRETLYRCLRYWEWREELSSTSKGFSTFYYSGVSIQLDKIFEKYVGRVWRDSLGDDFSWRPDQVRFYHLHHQGIEEGRREIKMDHCFFNRDESMLVIVDAKYSTNIGAEDHIYQMLSYANYQHPESPKRIVGCLVYPAQNWRVVEISDFNMPLFCIEIPITPTLFQEEIGRFVRDRLAEYKTI